MLPLSARNRPAISTDNPNAPAALTTSHRRRWSKSASENSQLPHAALTPHGGLAAPAPSPRPPRSQRQHDVLATGGPE
jgi:hypothetical protein